MNSRFFSFVLSCVLLTASLNMAAQSEVTLDRSQLDSVKMAKVDELLSRYFDAMEQETIEDKVQEVDYIISAVPQGDLRQLVGLRLYEHFLNSSLMGDEAVAIHIFDEWFATDRLHMNSELDKMNAAIFADFNRSSLLGMQAPRLSVFTEDGSQLEVPSEGRSSVLYFYDTDCSKCKMQTILLDYLFKDEMIATLDFYAIYVGDDLAEWKSYREEHFNFGGTDSLRIFHLWDPELQSDFQKRYGVIQTPKMFLISAKGEIIGRGLDVEALKKLLGYAEVTQRLYDRCPIGQKAPDIVLSGVLRSSDGLKNLTVSLSKLRGSKTFVALYSSNCSNCEAELKASSSKLSKKDRMFLVDLYQLSRENPELEQLLLDTFDLTELPFIFSLDSRGRVTDKYVSFQ